MSHPDGQARGDITFHWSAQPTDYREGLDLVHFKTIFGVARAIAKPMQFEYEELNDHYFISQPTIRMTFNEAKQLMQTLWDAGVRPISGDDSSGVNNTLRAHVKFAESVIDRTFQLLDHQKEQRAISLGLSGVFKSPGADR